jgi:hypothetical protein
VRTRKCPANGGAGKHRIKPVIAAVHESLVGTFRHGAMSDLGPLCALEQIWKPIRISHRGLSVASGAHRLAFQKVRVRGGVVWGPRTGFASQGCLGDGSSGCATNSRMTSKIGRNVGNPTLRRAFGFLDLSEPISRAFLSVSNVIVRQRELVRNSQM